MKYDPLANRVIMQEISEGKRTGGGIWIPDAARKNKALSFGKVLAVGPGRNAPDGKIVPCHVKEGDIVCFPRQAPAVLPLLDDEGNEHEVLMCPENDIIAIVHDLPQPTGIVDASGAQLSLVPQSLALPDQVYRNRDEHDRGVSDLRQQGAPPDVIADATMADHHEADADAVEY